MGIVTTSSETAFTQSAARIYDFVTDPVNSTKTYRLVPAAVQPYMSSPSTAGLGGMQTDEVAFEGLRRAVAAFNDLDTVAVLQKSL